MTKKQKAEKKQICESFNNRIMEYVFVFFNI